jgi:hypothetical protein
LTTGLNCELVSSGEKSQKQEKSDATPVTKQRRSPGNAVKEFVSHDAQQKTCDDSSDAVTAPRDQDKPGEEIASVNGAARQHLAATNDSGSPAEGNSLQQTEEATRTDSSQAEPQNAGRSKNDIDSCSSEDAQGSAASGDSERKGETQGDRGGGWFTGWHLTPLTQLTGAVKNTVNMIAKSAAFFHAHAVRTTVMLWKY